MLNRARSIRTLGGAIAASWMALGMWTAAADRPLAWLRSGIGNVEREMNAHASRGLRFAAVSDGIPGCAVIVMQAPEKTSAPSEYRIVSDKYLSGALDRLVEQGFVPRGSARGIGMRHDVIFERTAPAAASGTWRLIEFEKLEDLPAALTAAGGDGFRPAMLVRPAYRSWPGLSRSAACC